MLECCVAVFIQRIWALSTQTAKSMIDFNALARYDIEEYETKKVHYMEKRGRKRKKMVIFYNLKTIDVAITIIYVVIFSIIYLWKDTHYNKNTMRRTLLVLSFYLMKSYYVEIMWHLVASKQQYQQPQTKHNKTKAIQLK